MTRIILYSDFRPGTSDVVDNCLVEQLQGTRCRIGYIPSDSDLKRRYFAKIQDQYSKVGITDLFYFDLGEEFEENAIPRLLECDAIHLSGGNPFVFLDFVKKRGFSKHLASYLQKGGLLVGVSAGAMILSKSLGLAKDDFLEQKSRPGASKVRGLNLLNFEFYPHFKDDGISRKALTTYAKRFNTQVMACDDDAGMLVNDSQVEMLGKVTRFLPDGSIL